MPDHPHLDALLRAVAEAGAHERDELERLGRLPLGDRIATGVSWPRLAVDEASWAGRDHTRLRLAAPRGVELHDGLGPGDRVEVVIGEGSWVGTVREVGPRGAEVRVRGDAPETGRAEITRIYDPAPWRRLADALTRADGHDSPLRDVLLGEAPPSDPDPDAPAPLGALNDSQHSAGRTALAAGEVGLIHGPPGTGKTHLVVGLLARRVAEGDRPWALADSNAAVDHLAARAATFGLDVVRLGVWGRMGPEGRRLSLRRRIAEGPYGAALDALDRDLARLRSRTDRDSRRAAGRLARERRDLRDTAEEAALTSAEVLATTLGTLALRGARLPPAHTAVVDEATQAVEPAIWTAVPWVQRLILVGDPHQLGPVVRQPGSALERSLLDRLLDPADPAGGRLPLPMLTVQHRMHRAIQALVEDVYGDSYAAHPSVADHLLRDLDGVDDTPLTARPTLWIDTSGAGLDEAVDPVTASHLNPGEADLAEAVVTRLQKAGVRPEDIGVIAPYSAQVQTLRSRAGLAGVEVATVNAFQGREKEAIVCTWTRSNPDGDLGFVADGRRLTVALTRARRLHVSIGDAATLGGHPRFAALLDRLGDQEAWESVWSPPWSEVG